MASGINETFQQVGVALGIAIAGAFFENRVIHSFQNSASAAHLGSHSHDVAAAVSAGSIDAAAKSGGPSLAGQIAEDGRDAFTDGYHSTMTSVPSSPSWRP